MALQVSKVVSNPLCRQKSLQKVGNQTFDSESKPQNSTVITRLLTAGGLLGAFFLTAAAKDEPFSESLSPAGISKSIEDKQVVEKEAEISVASFADRLREIKSFDKRQKYLHNILSELNPQLLVSSEASKAPTALDLFNKKHNYSLECMGIKKIENKPYRFILINNFKNSNIEPIRLSLSTDDVLNTKTRKDVFKLLEKKLTEHKKRMEKQFSVWSSPYEYDFPKGGETVCMMALALSNLSGMESDLVRELEIYSKHYEMPIAALSIDEAHRPELEKLLKAQGFTNLPKFTKATNESILENFEAVLKKAIDEKKSKVVFHYMAHGGETGKISSSDGKILPEEIAKVISKKYKGKPICEQIDITVFAGTCYSGRQLDGIKKYFEEKSNIPVKNLRIITESKYTTASAGLTPEKASLVSDLMTDKSGPVDYYLSWYREHLQYLETKGIKTQSPVGTYLHAIRFADLMTRYDTSNKQNPLGFHYQHDPKEKKTTKKYFTDSRQIANDEEGKKNLTVETNEVIRT